MTTQPKPQFDAWADNYEAMHDAIAQQSFGDGCGFFLRAKLEVLLREMPGLGLAAPAPRVLDVGCGVGALEAEAEGMGLDWRLTGMDVSGKSVERAAQRGTRARFLVYDGERFPFRGRPFDLAVAACVFHHIPPAERAGVLREMGGAVRPGGLVAVFEHNLLNPVVRRVVRRYDFDRDARFLRLGETRRLFESAGLRPVRTGYYIFFPGFLRPLRPLEAQLRWLPLGGQFYCIGVAS